MMSASTLLSSDSTVDHPSLGEGNMVLMSDLHLGPNTVHLNHCFEHCISWVCAKRPQELLILGDLFDAYLGPDIDRQWLTWISDQLKCAVDAGVKVAFMPGNRDFLVSPGFIERLGGVYLPDPSLIVREGRRILLMHGDSLCVGDKRHQYYRRWVQQQWVKRLFLFLPRSIRQRIAASIKSRSRLTSKNELATYRAVDSEVVRQLRYYDAALLIHGHTHNPAIVCKSCGELRYKHLVLPDWLNKPEIICYNLNNNTFIWLDALKVSSLC